MEFVVKFSKPKTTRLGEAFWNKIVAETYDSALKRSSKYTLFFYSDEQHTEESKIILDPKDYYIEEQEALVVVEGKEVLMNFKVIKGRK